MDDEQATIVRGQTFDARDTLKAKGFTWNPKHRCWVLSPALHEADRFSLTKELRRIGLAGDLEVRNVKLRYIEDLE